MSDVIIVLGRGINDDGTLPVDPCSRVRKAADLYKERRAPYLVMSGAWTYHFDISPNRAESTAMKNYAIDLGVPGGSIIEESESMDTIGNVYFTKKNICEPRAWKNLTVVASGEHMPRVEYLFRKIYGPEYNFQFEISERVIDDAAYTKELKHELNSMTVTKKWLDSFEPGDDETIWSLMRTRHPAHKPLDKREVLSGKVNKDLYPDSP